MLNAGEDVLVFYNDKVLFNYFIKMMREYKQTGEMPEALTYHIDLIKLLTCCTLGKNVYTEIKCHSLLPLDDIVAMITHPDCIPEHDPLVNICHSQDSPPHPVLCLPHPATTRHLIHVNGPSGRNSLYHTPNLKYVMNKSQNGGKSPPINTDTEAGDYDGVTRNEQVTNNGVSQVLFGEILLAGAPYLETTNVLHPTGKY
ncbi:unnamed protein product [Danaus chrysippus]|uniref:(African queen) hypothetical protein n=1 Tax=Danaus chrysippus TaxID=151541 RepID=A0A8J2M8G7_9NEOP|nr:unnamed protein product [Danaus chrysippus]